MSQLMHPNQYSRGATGISCRHFFSEHAQSYAGVPAPERVLDTQAYIRFDFRAFFPHPVPDEKHLLDEVSLISVFHFRTLALVDRKAWSTSKATLLGYSSLG